MFSMTRTSSLTRAFADRHAIVTGGSRGLGFAIARALLAAGASVTICGRSRETLDRAVAKLGARGEPVFGIVCDVGDATACERMVAQSVAHFGPVDLLVNNAGIIQVGPLENQTLDDFREAMRTNFWGVVHATFAVLPQMRARRSGAIANVASVGGVVAVPHMLPYSASKFAQIGFTQGLAAEVASAGIRVTSVVPGLMITGSPDRAIFKGRNRAEYAWFAASDASPLLALPAEAAARRILRAIARRKTLVTIGWTASVPRAIAALVPGLVARVLRLVAASLPGGTPDRTSRYRGFESRSPLTERGLTASSDREAVETNERAS